MSKLAINYGSNLDPAKIPAHVAIIMDGNGRWAKRRGLPRAFGHRAGVKTVDKIVEASVQIGIKVLTLYTFSTENWKRPELEIKALMELFHSNLVSQREKLLKNDVQLRISGVVDAFPEKIRNEMLETIRLTSHCSRLILNLALGYSGRDEILNACKSIASDVRNGIVHLDDIDAKLFSERLYTRGLPDPELIIRTSGEYRLSNFLLWQCSYSEFFFTDTLWPNFKPEDLVLAIADYQQRDRRFGDVGQGGKV